MPAGDAQQVWFPEMIEELRSTWSRAMTWEELADLCGRMTAKRKDIRRVRNIQPPMIRCPECGQVSRSDISGVSIRSALFALRNHGDVPEAAFEELDRSWMRHKAKHDISTPTVEKWRHRVAKKPSAQILVARETDLSVRERKQPFGYEHESVFPGIRDQARVVIKLINDRR